MVQDAHRARSGFTEANRRIWVKTVIRTALATVLAYGVAMQISAHWALNALMIIHSNTRGAGGTRSPSVLVPVMTTTEAVLPARSLMLSGAFSMRTITSMRCASWIHSKVGWTEGKRTRRHVSDSDDTLTLFVGLTRGLAIEQTAIVHEFRPGDGFLYHGSIPGVSEAVSPVELWGIKVPADRVNSGLVRGRDLKPMPIPAELPAMKLITQYLNSFSTVAGVWIGTCTRRSALT